jgi:uncharacterized RDD family membrane protein YckC
MNRTKPHLYKRVIAYFIDLLIVTLLAGTITVMFTNTKEYDKYTKETIELTEKVLNEEISKEEYEAEYKELSYHLSKSSINVTIITAATTVVYYVIMCYFCHGITLGKFIMKLRIVGNRDEELTIFNYLLRSSIINNLLANVVTIIMIYSLSKESFINIDSKVGNVFTILFVFSFIVMMYRDDGRGLHDILGNTKVIDTKEVENNEIKSGVEEENRVTLNILNLKSKEEKKK